MTDPRWMWGKKYVQLRQDSSAKSPQKIGAGVSQGWGAYVNGDRLFIKRFLYLPTSPYPDHGSNLEIFTNERMLEVESLSPLATLEPGESIIHREDWYLFRSVTLGKTEEELDRNLQSYLSQTLAENQ